MNMQQIFEILDKEYQEYVNTVNSHPDSYVDEFVIMDECYKMLPNLVPDQFTQKVLTNFDGVVGGMIPVDAHSCKKMIVAMFLADKQSS